MKKQSFHVTDVIFAYYRHRPKGYSLDKSNRTSNGLTLLLSGSLEITFAGVTRTVCPGDIILQRKGDSYSLKAGSADVEFIVISYLAEPGELLSSLLPERVFSGDHSVRYRSAFEAVCRIYASRGVCHEPLLCALVQEILCNIIRENYRKMF